MSDPVARRIADTLRRAIEKSDPEALIDLYADEAEFRIVDRTRPPSAPHVLRGKNAIAEHLRDVCGREMTHRIEQEIVGENRLAFTEACEYPDGCRVLCASLVELQNGKIFRQLNVQAWDE